MGTCIASAQNINNNIDDNPNFQGFYFEGEVCPQQQAVIFHSNAIGINEARCRFGFDYEAGDEEGDYPAADANKGVKLLVKINLDNLAFEYVFEVQEEHKSFEAIGEVYDGSNHKVFLQPSNQGLIDTIGDTYKGAAFLRSGVKISEWDIPKPSMESRIRAYLQVVP